MDCSPSLVTLNRFSVGLTLPAHARIRLLRTETVYAGLTILQILLAGGTHLVLFHQRQKGWPTYIARLKKMRAVRLLEAVQCHLHWHPAGLAQMFFRGPFHPFRLKLLLACITGTYTGVVADRIFLMLALGHSVGILGFSLCVGKEYRNPTRKTRDKNRGLCSIEHFLKRLI